jgi:hypothetical protein
VTANPWLAAPTRDAQHQRVREEGGRPGNPRAIIGSGRLPRVIDVCKLTKEIRHPGCLFEPGSLLPQKLPPLGPVGSGVRVLPSNPLILLAPRAGLEPATKRLTDGAAILSSLESQAARS